MLIEPAQSKGGAERLNLNEINPMQEYFEEVIELEPKVRCLGTHSLIPEEGRQCGYAGRKFLTLTEPFTLRRGHKFKQFSASEKKPRKVMTMVHILGTITRKDDTKDGSDTR